jgi:D-amino peptidase
MRLLISADIEGVAGVARPEQIQGGSSEHEMACRLMVGEVNAAVEGALAKGVQEVVVVDAHANGLNLPPDALHPRAELLNGRSFRLGLAPGIAPAFDAAFFIGYPASPGSSEAMLSSVTSLGHVLQGVRINGEPQSRGSLDGYLCGYYECPLALFTGDAAAVSEMHRFHVAVESVVVKESLGACAARSLHPEVARERIRTSAGRAIERLGTIPPLRLDGRLDLEVDFVHPVMADSAERIPQVERLGPCTLRWVGDDYVELYRCLSALVDLARLVAC